MNETRDLLMRTKRLLTSGRWCQHTMRRYHGINGSTEFCLVGGLRETSDYHRVGASPEYVQACVALAEARTGQNVGRFGLATLEHTIITFNDYTGRSVDEVADLIDQAAERVPA